MTINLTEIMKALIGLATVVLTGFVIPLLQSKLNEQQYTKMVAACDVAVYAAEQLYLAGEGEQKLDYAMNYMHELGYDITLPEIRTAIEAAVKRLKLALAA